jgi:hypothetical protein
MGIYLKIGAGYGTKFGSGTAEGYGGEFGPGFAPGYGTKNGELEGYDCKGIMLQTIQSIGNGSGKGDGYGDESGFGNAG